MYYIFIYIYVYICKHKFYHKFFFPKEKALKAVKFKSQPSMETLFGGNIIYYIHIFVEVAVAQR